MEIEKVVWGQIEEELPEVNISMLQSSGSQIVM